MNPSDHKLFAYSRKFTSCMYFILLSFVYIYLYYSMSVFSLIIFHYLIKMGRSCSQNGRRQEFFFKILTSKESFGGAWA